MSYRLLPHTADIRASLDAPDLPALYQAAVDLVREVLVGDGIVEPMDAVTVPPDGEDEGEQFFRFVRELVYLNDVDLFLPLRVTSMAPPTVAGEPFDPVRHVCEHQIKAVTRHQYTFTRHGDGYHVEVVFDL